MKSYWAVVSARFRMLLQYRAAAAAGFGTQLFWGLIRVMIFEAFYRSTTAPQPMNLPEVVTYIWLGQAFLAMLPWNVDADIRAMVRSGNVAYELVRPLDLYTFWFCRALAMRAAPTLLRAVPMFVVAGLFFGMTSPPSWASVGAWAFATLGALLLSCATTTLLNISLLWTVSGDGIAVLVATGMILLSGLVVPLPLFPDWTQPVLRLLPFRGVGDTPFRLYTGHIPPDQAVAVVAHQVMWAIAFIALGHRMLGRGIRRLVVQGG
jgi:ABC-2 type transport system permease protein